MSRKDLTNPLRVIEEAPHIERFHTFPTIGKQNIASHSWGVALLTHTIYEGEPPVEAIMYALCHDIHEIEVGDVPAPTKWKHPALKEQLNKATDEFERIHNIQVPEDEEVLCVVDIADKLEGMLNCIREIKLGNMHMILVYTRWRRAVTNKETRKLYNSKVCTAIRLKTNGLINEIQDQFVRATWDYPHYKQLIEAQVKSDGPSLKETE